MRWRWEQFPSQGRQGKLRLSLSLPRLRAYLRAIWASLLHLSFNMWCDRPVECWGALPKEDVDIVTY